MESSADIPMTHHHRGNDNNAGVDDGNGDSIGSAGLSRQLSVSTIAGGGGDSDATTASAPVPDVLLSLAKDDRYISEVSSLLSQVAVPFASIFLLPWRGGDGTSFRRGSNENYDGDEILEDDGRRFIERIRPELTLLASLIVHSATFVFYTRNFGGIAERNSESSIQRSLGMDSLNLAYRYPARKIGGSSPSSTTSTKIITNKYKISRFRNYLVMMLPSWKLRQWQMLLFLQTIVPYFIQRVGRGGWAKDLGCLVSTFLDRVGLSSISSGIAIQRTIDDGPENVQMSEGDSDAMQNDDRLRGSARRRLFEEQRRRMLNYSNGTSEADANGSVRSSLEDGLIVNDLHTNEMQHDSSSFSANRLTTLSPQRNNLVGSRLRMISSSSWNVISRISLAVSSLSHGAHSLPRHSRLDTGESLDRHVKIIKWFLRLHLALFYWNGIYPTIAHRLAGAKIRDNVTPYSAGSSYSPLSGAIVANRPTYKPIAALILLQTLAAFAQMTAESSIEVAHSVQIAFFRWRQRRRMQHQPNSGGRVNQDENERAEYMELIEERVPGISSAKIHAVKSTHNSRGKKQKQQEICRSDSHQCGICLNERVHPAAPSVCGHVFCWNCILHWTSNVRAECPLCRAQARPQDIIPLYNCP